MSFIANLFGLLMVLLIGPIAVVVSVFAGIIMSAEFAAMEYWRMLKKSLLDTFAPGRCKGMEQNLKQVK